MFQFQTGAIKSNKRLVNVRTDIQGFNSKLVRLKVDWASEKHQRRNSFNSKLVRLKVALRLLGSTLFEEQFQFQTGAIKSLHCLKNMALQSRFNSKLVRLKDRNIL